MLHAMNTIYALFIALLFAASSLQAEEPFQYDLTVCTIFQDDAEWLPEWINFHLRQGVEHFYLYNNLSNDDYKRILTPYIDQNLVTLIDWPEKSNNINEFASIQARVYNHCLSQIKKIAKWCAIIDTDEFLFSVDGSSLINTLNLYDKFQGVVVNWVCYGTGGVDKIPLGSKMTDTLLMRAPIQSEHNRLVKSIVKPASVAYCDSPHFCIMKPGNFCVTENKEFHGANFRTKKVSVNKLRINHYWARDLDFFYNVKIDRWIKWGMPYTKAIEKEAEMNAEYDPILIGF